MPLSTLASFEIIKVEIRLVTRAIHGPCPRVARVASRSKSAVLPICGAGTKPKLAPKRGPLAFEPTQKFPGEVRLLSRTNRCGHNPQISARVFARSIILSRSRFNAFLLSSSRSAGIDENAVSIAMSFASAKFKFINCNSCSILSRVRFDKSLSGRAMGCEGRRWAFSIQRRSHHIAGLPTTYPTDYVRFGSFAVLQNSTTPQFRKGIHRDPFCNQ